MNDIYDICCGKEIQKLAKLTYILEKNTFKSKGFTSSQANIILELLNKEPINMKSISKKMALDCSTMTRNISKLIELGIVEKKVCDCDKRVIKINLTSKGEKKGEEIKKAFTEHMTKLVCKIPKDKFDVIFEGIGLLTEILEEEIYSK